jgi:hypothetical protein
MSKSKREENLNVEDFVNEERLSLWLNVSSKQLGSMRQRGMPYCQLANNVRMYDLQSVIRWMKTKERNQIN